jgi:hypothetical protein
MPPRVGSLSPNRTKRRNIRTKMADPQKYRDEADRIVAEAKLIEDGEAKERAIEIARQYQRLAEIVAKRPTEI